MIKALLASLIATLLVACKPTAETGSAQPEHRVGETPIPQGSAGPCDAGPGKTCGTYPSGVHLTTPPRGHVTTLVGNGDGGYGFSDATPGGGIITAANGGNGAAMTCSSAQVPIWQSSTYAACETLSGDCTTSASGVVTCTQLQGGEVTCGSSTGTLTAVAGATAPGLTQAAQTTDTAPPNEVIAAGGAYASAVTHLTGGKLVLGDGAGATSGGINGGVDILLNGQTYASNILTNPFRLVAGSESSGTAFFACSPVTSNSSDTVACWFGNHANSGGTLSNANLYHAINTLQISEPTNIQLEWSGYNRFEVDTNGSYTNSGTNLGVNGTPSSVGGGSGVEVLLNATTAPTTSVSGETIVYSSGGSLFVYPSGVTSPTFNVSSTATSLAGYEAIAGTVPGSTIPGNCYLGEGTGGALVVEDTAKHQTTIGNGLTCDSTQTTCGITQTGGSTASVTGPTLTIQGAVETGTTSNGGQVVINSGTGTSGNGAITINAGTGGTGSAVILTGSLGIEITGPVVGNTGSPFVFGSSAIAMGTGGTTTVSAAQSLTPNIVLTSGTLTSGAILDFTTQFTTTARTGNFFVDATGMNSGAALGTFGLSFKNGTVTQSLTSLPAGGMIIIYISGANHIAIN